MKIISHADYILALNRCTFEDTDIYFGNCLLIIHIGGRVYPVRHYPIAKRLRDRGGSRHSMYCAQSSEWGLFGRNTRSAFRRTPSRKMQPILQSARTCLKRRLCLLNQLFTTHLHMQASDVAVNS